MWEVITIATEYMYLILEGSLMIPKFKHDILNDGMNKRVLSTRMEIVINQPKVFYC